MEETSQVMIKILFGILVERREDGKESISPEQLDSVWDLLPLIVKFRLPELSAMSLLYFDNLEDLYYRLGGKANSRITLFLLPQVYRLGKAGDDRILENLGKACRSNKGVGGDGSHENRPTNVSPPVSSMVMGITRDNSEIHDQVGS